jgi:CheY-like chemotaxis protein
VRKKRILIVDDDVATTRLLKFGLEKTGFYEVREENNCANALAVARAFKPDFTILDVCMPGVAGGDLAAQFAADPSLKRIPVVFVTSMVSEEEAGEKPLLSGGYHFFAKPINLRRLVRYIEATVPNEPEPFEHASHGLSTPSAPVS